MYLTLHLDNKRFLCLFVKFVLYRGPVLCEKHLIPFFIFPPPPHLFVNLFIVFPVRTKTFFTHVASKMVHVVRKTGLSTHAGNEPPASSPPQGAFIRLPPEPDAATPCFWER